MRFDTGVTDVPTAGTQVQIKNTRDKVVWIKFKSLAGNNGITYVGVSDVSASNGYELDPSGGVDGELVLDFRPGSILASAFWVGVATNGDDIAWAMILQ